MRNLHRPDTPLPPGHGGAGALLHKADVEALFLRPQAVAAQLAGGGCPVSRAGGMMEGHDGCRLSGRQGRAPMRDNAKSDPLDLRIRQLRAWEECLAALEAGTIYRNDPNRPAYLEWARGKIEQFRGYVHRLLERN
jgi:hypothetical protein